MSPSRLPGYSRLEWLSHPSIRAGVLYGIYLAVVMSASVVAANRIPALEEFADVRNWIARSLFGAVMALPVVVSFRQPQRLLVSSLVGWSLATLTYGILKFFFADLHSELGISTFHLFILGAVIYVAAAVAAWVFSMALEVRSAPATATRRRP